MEESTLLSGVQSRARDILTFKLNGIYQKARDLPTNTSLLSYIRDNAQLKGTKFMCREGGCGICIVNITYTHPISNSKTSIAVNSCLFPVYACHGMSVTTIEGIGNRQDYYHPLQERLAFFYGTQCGYCSPGWIMAMYSLLQSNPLITMKEVEESFGSNVCRCTGYRPILDAFKTFAHDCNSELKQKVTDIEELVTECRKKGQSCSGGRRGCNRKVLEKYSQESENMVLTTKSLRFTDTIDGTWFRVGSVFEIFEIFEMISGTYMLVGGNTAQGIFEFKYPKPPDVYIDINGVHELHSHFFSKGNLHLGANTTLTDTLNLFKSLSKEYSGNFGYLCVLAKHIKKVAHIPVRNVGTLAGNLTAKHIRNRFESDLFTIFETVGVRLKIDSAAGMSEVVSLPQYLQTDMHKKVITEVIFQCLDSSCYYLKTYKVAKISQNSHAYVNAGFLFKFDENYRVVEQPSIVYGGISPDFVHASKTESFLNGHALLDNSTIQGALASLDEEVQPDRELPQSSEEYRKGLAFSLFYKFVLSVNPQVVESKYRSGANELKRPLSSGKQEFPTIPSKYPVTKPMPKLEALIQCSGEAEYTYDIPVTDADLFAALVISDRGPAMLVEVDASEALAIKGVVAFFVAKDIPGRNTFGVLNTFIIKEEEKCFADGRVDYAGQRIGVIVAETQEIADYAVPRVKITYAGFTKPDISVPEVLKSGRLDRIVPQDPPAIVPTETKPDVRHVIMGEHRTEGQYHNPMETNSCVIYPTSEGLDVFVSSQWPQTIQEGISALLDIPVNSINVAVRRIGGSFGGKLTRCNMPTCACALAAYLLRRPVRIFVNMQTQMEALGVRKPCYITYEVGVNDEGEIQNLFATHYDNVGSTINEDQASYNASGFKNVYNQATFSVLLFNAKTDRVTTCWMRAPGTLTIVVEMENIMEHIASVVKKDPLEVRMVNFDPIFKIDELFKELSEKADYDKRVECCETFNANNVWKKRGINFLPMNYNLSFAGTSYVTISIYRNDGTVAITHGGIELGQGLNTQVAQTCARELGVPVRYIYVKTSTVLTSPNNIGTGGSITSDSVTFATIKCCKVLNERLSPVREKLRNPCWEKLIKQAYLEKKNLNAYSQFNPNRDGTIYTKTACAICEVEVDCLTGEHLVVRVDILEDGGESVNPKIDIGQVEGAFVQGLGFFTIEDLIYDPETGSLRSNRSWEYKVPQAQDIPIDFRVYLKKNSYNKIGPTRAKGISEPPIILAYSVLLCMRSAIRAVKRDLGHLDEFFDFSPPATREKTFLTIGSNYKNYKI